MDRLAAAPVPDERCLALVGDADRRDGARVGARVRERVARGLKRRPPEVLRVVLDGAVAGEMLRELVLAEAARGKRLVEEDRAARGGALIEGEDQRLHRHARIAQWSSVVSGSAGPRPARSP